MITYVNGTIFASPAQVLVNTVNTEGVMGKGLALRFKQIYPEMFARYQELCENGQINIGKLWLFKTEHKWILNFPTKNAWRQPSRIEYLAAGLKKFHEEFIDLKIHSIAFPALGCGNGELEWNEVRPLMENYLSGLPISVFIHPPQTENSFPEHRTPKEIAEWLRAEPRTLAFSEVWRDLKLLLAEQTTFTTGSREFKAHIEESLSDRVLVATTEDRPYRISYDELKETWASFRSLGYLRRGFVTVRVEKYLSYLTPILAELPYVETVVLGEKGSNRTSMGLQYLATSDRVDQPSLFV